MLKGQDLSSFISFSKERPLVFLGLLIVLVSFVLAAFSPWIVPYPPEVANPKAILQPPSLDHWFGTDGSGMDIFSRTISAPRTDLTIAFIAAFLSAVIGTPLGVISGYDRGFLGEVIARGLDIIQTFPPFILAMAAVAISGQNIRNVIFVLAATNAPAFARLVRSKVYSLRDARFVEAARCSGNPDHRIIFRHLLPNSWLVVAVQFSVTMGWAMLLTAGLSFVGAGVRVPTPEWGSMISIGAANIMTGEWWVALFPGAALGITVLGFAILGNAAEELLDPSRR